MSKRPITKDSASEASLGDDLNRVDRKPAGVELRAFVDQFDVRCPECRAHAIASMVHRGTKGTYREVLFKPGAARITCVHCGFSRATPGGDDRYEFWYVTEFDGHRLWAENRRHLDFLIDWLVRGGSRIHRNIADRAYLEALPKWLRAGRNRAAILRRLRRLRGDHDG